jgi:hypothetical protein
MFVSTSSVVAALLLKVSSFVGFTVLFWAGETISGEISFYSLESLKINSGLYVHMSGYKKLVYLNTRMNALDSKAQV